MRAELTDIVIHNVHCTWAGFIAYAKGCFWKEFCTSISSFFFFFNSIFNSSWLVRLLLSLPLHPCLKLGRQERDDITRKHCAKSIRKKQQVLTVWIVP